MSSWAKGDLVLARPPGREREQHHDQLRDDVGQNAFARRDERLTLTVIGKVPQGDHSRDHTPSEDTLGWTIARRGGIGLGPGWSRHQDHEDAHQAPALVRSGRWT
jgi:hypothetical protein